MIFTSDLDWLAFGWFLLLWVGYTVLARVAARRKVNCLAIQLYQYRSGWAENALRRENRMFDICTLDTIQKMANFLATTTIFAIAGLITALSSAKNLKLLLEDHPFIVEPTQEQVEFKLGVMVLIFVFAFFRLTWAMRQHTFLLLLLGATPQIKSERLSNEEEHVVDHVTKILDRAGHEFNYGLRAYYFALAFLAWFINPLFFMATSIFVVYVLYRREFRSPTLKYLTQTRQAINALGAADAQRVAASQ